MANQKYHLDENLSRNGTPSVHVPLKHPDLIHAHEKQLIQVHKLFFSLLMLALLPKTYPRHHFGFHQKDIPPKLFCLSKKMHYERKDDLRKQCARDQKQLSNLLYRWDYY